MKIEEIIHGVMELGKQPAPVLTQVGTDKAIQAVSGEPVTLCHTAE